MSPAIPRAAAGIFDEGVLAHIAVSTPMGIHLTPTVFVQDGGRLWLTTSRSSVKVRTWRRDDRVSGMVCSGGVCVTFRGHARIYDALDPLSWPASVVAGPRLVRAGARFSLKNARFFAGYAADARRVPMAWSPPGRVFVAVSPTSGRVVHGEDGTIGGGWGAWPVGSTYLKTFQPLPKRRHIDLRAPASVRAAVGATGVGALALDGPDGLTVLPASWSRVAGEGSHDAVLPRSILDLARAPAQTGGAMTVDRASTWRASSMVGMLLQGSAQLYTPETTTRGRRAVEGRVGGYRERALVRLKPDRVVWWKGWKAGSAPSRRPEGSH